MKLTRQQQNYLNDKISSTERDCLHALEVQKYNESILTFRKAYESGAITLLDTPLVPSKGFVSDLKNKSIQGFFDMSILSDIESKYRVLKQETKNEFVSYKEKVLFADNAEVLIILKELEEMQRKYESF